MIRRVVWGAALLATMVVVPAPGGAQERIDRFSAPASPVMVQPRLDADASRSTYWREGALIGAAVGVVAAIVLIDTSNHVHDRCPGPM